MAGERAAVDFRAPSCSDSRVLSTVLRLARNVARLPLYPLRLAARSRAPRELWVEVSVRPRVLELVQPMRALARFVPALRPALATSIEAVRRAIDTAVDDPRVAGVVFVVPPLHCGWATATSLRDQFRQYPELFASHRFWGYCLSATFASGAFFAFIGGAPFVGVQVYGLDSVQVGLCVGAPALGYFSGNFLSGRYSIRMGVNWMITAGAAISTLGMVFPFILNLIGAHGPTLFFGAVTLVGLGNGLLMPSANAGMLSVRPHLAGSASGIGGAIMIFGGALLSALAGWMLGPGSTAMPLIVIMLVSSALALAAIFYTIRRERQISGGF